MTDAHPAPPTEPPSALGIQDILNTLPHRFPFVLVTGCCRAATAWPTP